MSTMYGEVCPNNHTIHVSNENNPESNDFKT